MLESQLPAESVVVSEERPINNTTCDGRASGRGTPRDVASTPQLLGGASAALPAEATAHILELQRQNAELREDVAAARREVAVSRSGGVTCDMRLREEWKVDHIVDFSHHEFNPATHFATFIKENPQHAFSRLMKDDRINAEKKITVAFSAKDFGPASWERLTDVPSTDVQLSVDAFRRLMKAPFVLAKVASLMGAVGVHYDDTDVPKAVDAFLQAAHRGFARKWLFSEYFFGVTLSVDFVVICDDAAQLTLPRTSEVIAGQRVLTLLHEFAHFFPRFVSAKCATVPEGSREESPYATPEKPRVRIKDVPDSEWRPEAGQMFERMLFGRAVSSHVNPDNAKRLLSWDGSERLTLPPSTEVSTRSGGTPPRPEDVVARVNDQPEHVKDHKRCCSIM